jgi:hypothetical protein
MSNDPLQGPVWREQFDSLMRDFKKSQAQVTALESALQNIAHEANARILLTAKQMRLRLVMIETLAKYAIDKAQS